MKLVVTISITLFLCILLMQSLNAEVLELSEDEQGMPVWKQGEYRDRNEVPLPPNYDEERKHRRDVSDSESELDQADTKAKTKKKNLINRGKKGKKADVPQGYDKYTPNNLRLSEKADQYLKLNLQRPDRKSSVVKNWGLTYDNLFPETPKEATGQMRSKLEGGYKITEEDLDNGMMFRGLGGLMLRDQNHQIIQSKFAEQDDSDEEMNARSDVTNRHSAVKRGLFHFSHIFNPFNHHHHHHPHHHHFKPTQKATVSQIPQSQDKQL